MPVTTMRADTGTSTGAGVELSVVIASYGAASTIERCLRSLEQQTTGDAFEVIVVDSSTDDTARLVERGFPRVRLIRRAVRCFPGDARNIGVSSARGGVLAF